MFLVVFVFVCNTVTFESLDIESSFFGLLVYIQKIRVKLIYEGHRLKVRVTSENNGEVNVKLQSAITPVL